VKGTHAGAIDLELSQLPFAFSSRQGELRGSDCRVIRVLVAEQGVDDTRKHVITFFV